MTDDIRAMQTELAEYRRLKADGRLVELPCAIGDTVYHVCTCEDIPAQLDGTLYSHDGGFGTATGYYCPYEQNCPHDIDDCDAVKKQLAVFEDCITELHLSEDGTWIALNNTPNIVAGDIGKTVFLTRAAAEAALAEKGPV